MCPETEIPREAKTLESVSANLSFLLRTITVFGTVGPGKSRRMRPFDQEKLVSDALVIQTDETSAASDLPSQKK
jgi:hypothetical protein